MYNREETLRDGTEVSDNVTLLLRYADDKPIITFVSNRYEDKRT